MKKKRHFTLIELIITLIVIGILVTIAIPTYRNVVERSRSEVCKTNLEVLLGAIKNYALEKDYLPASLGQLEDGHIRYAWDQVLESKGTWRVNFAYFVVNFAQGRVVFAQDYWSEVLSIACPSDDTPPPQGHSYGINQEIAGKSLEYFQGLDPSVTVVADSDSSTFPPTASRHKHYTLTGVVFYSQSIQKDGTIITYEPGSQATTEDSSDSDSSGSSGC